MNIQSGESGRFGNGIGSQCGPSTSFRNCKTLQNGLSDDLGSVRDELSQKDFVVAIQEFLDKRKDVFYRNVNISFHIFNQFLVFWVFL